MAEIEKFSQNKHRHIVDIARKLFENTEEFGQKVILGRPPRRALAVIVPRIKHEPDKTHKESSHCD